MTLLVQQTGQVVVVSASHGDGGVMVVAPASPPKPQRRIRKPGKNAGRSSSGEGFGHRLSRVLSPCSRSSMNSAPSAPDTAPSSLGSAPSSLRRRDSLALLKAPVTTLLTATRRMQQRSRSQSKVGPGAEGGRTGGLVCRGWDWDGSRDLIGLGVIIIRYGYSYP